MIQKVITDYIMYYQSITRVAPRKNFYKSFVGISLCVIIIMVASLTLECIQL